MKDFSSNPEGFKIVWNIKFSVELVVGYKPVFGMAVPNLVVIESRAPEKS